MNFAQVDQRYSALRQQFDAGRLSVDEFNAALREMMIQDTEGRWWWKERESGAWNYYDQGAKRWIEAQPPAAQSPPAYYAKSPATPIQSAAPSIGRGLAIVFYLASFLIPLVGIALFFAFRRKPHPSDRRVATISLIVAVVSIALGVIVLMGSG